MRNTNRYRTLSNQRRGKKRGRIFLCVLVAVALVITCVSVHACSSQTAGTAAGYVSPYTWSNLVKSNGRLVYKVNGKVKSQAGIDVSSNQGTIDWSAVKADGIQFAIIRIGCRGTTAGNLYVDRTFERNLTQAKAAGIECGVYFFSQARTKAEAREEARFVVKYLAGRSLAYPVIYDSEYVQSGCRTADLSVAQMTACAQAFCTRVEKAGYRSMIYGNAADIARYDSSFTSSARVWLACYDAHPDVEYDFTMWQYSESGRVDGISKKVDLDLNLQDVTG